MDAQTAGIAPGERLAAIGLGDAAPVFANVALAGATLRPLTPVRGTCVAAADGTRTLRWVRRARGAWLWRDGVDAPLVEQVEAYSVEFGDASATVARWEVGEAQLAIAAAVYLGLIAAIPAGRFWIRQSGTFDVSLPLEISN